MLTINLSQRIESIKPSPTIMMADTARELRVAGQDIISLSIGEPDFDTPQFIKDAAIKAIQEGKTKYSPVDGFPELKDAIIKKFLRENQLNYQPSQILVSCGAKHSIYNIYQALINPGDEVIIPAPYWVSYPSMVLLAGGRPVIVQTDAKQRFKITARQLAQAITPQTRLFMINSPSNPSGMCYSREELGALAEVLQAHPDVYVVTDDIYEHIIWETGSFINIIKVCPDLYDRVIVVNGVSKAYAMTGWRIGYAAGSEAIIKAMKKGQSQATSGPCSISQMATITALNGPQDCLKTMCDEFHQRHNYVVNAINKIPGFHCQPNDGTFYAFIDVSGAINALSTVGNDIEFAQYLLTEAGVAVVPGTAFGCDAYIRLSYAADMATLRQAIERIKRLFC